MPLLLHLESIVSDFRHLFNQQNFVLFQAFVFGFMTHTNGIIEAIESPSHRFAIGVQYHPERMLQDPELRKHGHKLFEAFVQVASQS